jgi:hypothetical protein
MVRSMSVLSAQAAGELDPYGFLAVDTAREVS